MDLSVGAGLGFADRGDLAPYSPSQGLFRVDAGSVGRRDQREQHLAEGLVGIGRLALRHLHRHLHRIGTLRVDFARSARPITLSARLSAGRPAGIPSKADWRPFSTRLISSQLAATSEAPLTSVSPKT